MLRGPGWWDREPYDVRILERHQLWKLPHNQAPTSADATGQSPSRTSEQYLTILSELRHAARGGLTRAQIAGRCHLASQVVNPRVNRLWQFDLVAILALERRDGLHGKRQSVVVHREFVENRVTRPYTTHRSGAAQMRATIQHQAEELQRARTCAVSALLRLKRMQIPVDDIMLSADSDIRRDVAGPYMAARRAKEAEQMKQLDKELSQ